MQSSAPLKRVAHDAWRLAADGHPLEGVDVLEFDVLPEPGEGGRLVLAHDKAALEAGDYVPLDEALRRLDDEPYGRLEVILDLKWHGFEQRLAECVRSCGRVERTLVSTMHWRSLGRLREVEPGLRLGWSVPRAGRDYTRWPLLGLVALVLLLVLRAALPPVAGWAIRRGRCDAVMAYWRLVTPRLARAVRRAGGELYAWTIEDAPRVRALAALGVAGVIVDDLSLFEGEPTG